MPTLISDTIKARSNFPIGYSTDIQIDSSDSRSVKDVLGDAGAIATKTSRGVVQIGDGIDVTLSTDTTPGLISLSNATDTTIGGVKIGDGVSVDTGTISVPFYVEVSDTEPADKSKLWVDTSAVYNPTGDEIPISEEEGNSIVVKSDGLYVQNDTYSTDETVIGTWIDGKPVYRKVVNLGNNYEVPTSSTKVDLDIDASTTEAIVNSKILNVTTSGETCCQDAVIYANAGNFYFYGKESRGAKSTRYCYFILEYTKTTD